MTDADVELLTAIAGRSCPACTAPKPADFLLCRRCWRDADGDLKRDWRRTLARYRRNEAALGELLELEHALVASVS